VVDQSCQQYAITVVFVIDIECVIYLSQNALQNQLEKFGQLGLFAQSGKIRLEVRQPAKVRGWSSLTKTKSPSNSGGRLCKFA
jgi:hypothetical protein